MNGRRAVGVDPAARSASTSGPQNKGSTPMPPRSTVSKTPGKIDEPTTLEAMADDAAAAPVDYPPGAPVFKSLIAIRPFSRRAAFKRCYAEVAERKGELDKLQAEAAKHEEGTEAHYAAQLRVWAAMDEVFEKVNGALRLAAVDPEAYDAWSDGLADDNDLMTTFNAFQQRTQPGEASSSPS